MKSSPMNLEVNGKFLAANMTGVHRVAYELVRQLALRAHELNYLFDSPVLLRAPRNSDFTDMPQNISFIVGSYLTGQLWEQFELPLRTHDNILLNFCNLSPILSRNSITMIHDAQVFSTPESYSRTFVNFYRTIQPIIGRKARRILTVSNYSASELAKYNVAPPERIRVIHNGIDHASVARADPTILARLGLDRHRYVLALSSTQAHKNIATLLAAFAKGALPEIRLVLFGTPSRQDLTTAGLNLPQNVLCTGRLSDSELRGLMDNALCFAMPSLTEGFGLPPLEAMRVGCPAIVSTSGALPEVCGEAALYASPLESAAWAKAILALANDPVVRAEYARLGIVRASSFTWERAGDALMSVLREVAAERRTEIGFGTAAIYR